MSEQYTTPESNEQSRASEFFSLHVAVLKDYAAYVEQVTAAWRDHVAAESPSEAPRGFWLRANGESGSEFGAHINYWAPSGEKLGCLAAIDIADGEIQVWQPKGDGTGEPVVATREAYTLPALERAIVFVEQQTK